MSHLLLQSHQDTDNTASTDKPVLYTYWHHKNTPSSKCTLVKHQNPNSSVDKLRWALTPPKQRLTKLNPATPKLWLHGTIMAE